MVRVSTKIKAFFERIFHKLSNDTQFDTLCPFGSVVIDV